MENIMKIVDIENALNKTTKYILRPENIFEMFDDVDGCHIGYANDTASAVIEGISARGLKRSIQDKLEQPLGYLKTRYEYVNQKFGNRYFNVDHIAAVHSHGTLDRNNELIEVCSIVFERGGAIKIYHPAHEVAYQIRRVLKRLDQDEEICCAPKAEQESEE